MQMVMMNERHPARAFVQATVRRVYDDAYGAQITAFPELMVGTSTMVGSRYCSSGAHLV
ncbi:MAG: hypothetical protein ACI9W2_004209 [Gammaproteobacteria bacterium]|jgi:hypothetical protein